MNRTLEELAAAIFKSWFVDFDPVVARAEGRQPFGMDAETAALFPAAFEETEVGPVPVGWRVGKVRDLFDLTMGQSSPGTTYNEDGMVRPFYQGRTDFGFRFGSAVHCTAPTRFAEPGDTLVSVALRLVMSTWPGEHCCVGRGPRQCATRVAAGRLLTTPCARCGRNSRSSRVRRRSLGSISSGGFRNIRISFPNSEVIEAYERLAQPLDQSIESNEHESATLAAIRDALLPKLMAGEIRVG